MQYIIKKLLQMIAAENMEEEEIEEIVDTKFKEIIAEGKIDRKIITTTETMKAIRRMKNKKVGDKNKWKTDWIKKEGIEMVQSLATQFNRVEEENKIPIQ